MRESRRVSETKKPMVNGKKTTGGTVRLVKLDADFLFPLSLSVYPILSSALVPIARRKENIVGITVASQVQQIS